MIVESADLDGLLTLGTEGDHFASWVEMLVSEVIVLESFVVEFAIIAVVLWIRGLLWYFGRIIDDLFNWGVLFDLYFLNDSSILLYFILDHPDDLRFESHQILI